MVRTSKIALAFGLALGALGFGGALAQDTQPRVSLARDIVAAASAFETYTRTASAIDAGFAGPREVASAVQVAAAHDPQQLEAGMIAYAAMVALQDHGFVEGVQKIVADPTTREALIRRLAENPDTAIALPGADEAAARARSALLAHVEPLLANGVRVKQAAYDIQRKDWSRAMVQDPSSRLAMVKQLAGQAFTPSEADANRLFQAVSAPDQRRAGTPGPAVVRGLALAAMAMAGQTNEDNVEAFRPLLTEARSASCVRMAKLNLFQCMAVAGPHYEDVFCISQHAMLEAGQCLASAAGPDAAPASVETAQAGGVLFPIASPIPRQASDNR